MCGIAGIWRLNGGEFDPGILERMCRSIRYRGPDEEGIRRDGGVGLAHRRLSIIDLAGGQQPMPNATGDLWITYNGEIFNYLELRKELEALGRRFRTQSDTEVILQSYEEYGDACVERFNGQWAFAIWDSRRARLFLSRDRMGVRPLFFTVADGNFVFASEVKAIFCHPAVPREIDPVALDQVFTFWHAQPPRTIFRGIQILPPGHSMAVEAGKVRFWPYWRLDYALDSGPADEVALTARLHELLVDATRLRLRADVPVGAYLSGGLDSTVITGLIKRFTDTPLKTFSVVFEDAEFDESGYQQEAVRYLGTEHFQVNCTKADICRVFPEVIWHAETPILRTAPAPLFILSDLVRQHGYKVVLTGEGSDEMLGGYDLFKEAKIRRFWGAQPNSRCRPLLLKKLYPYMKNLQSQSESYLRAFFHVDAEKLKDPFFSHIPRWDLTAKLKSFFSEDTKAAIGRNDPLAEMGSALDADFAAWSPFAQAQWLETTGLLPGYILSSQGDRMSMAHSVEGRFPFLDHRVVEFASRLPARLKMKALDEKYLLKRAAKDLIPDSILRRHKQPYRAPDAASFFADGRGREDYVEDLLSAKRLREDGLFDPGSVSRLLDKVRRGRAIGVKDNMAFVGILSTQLCLSKFVKQYGVN